MCLHDCLALLNIYLTLVSAFFLHNEVLNNLEPTDELLQLYLGRGLQVQCPLARMDREGQLLAVHLRLLLDLESLEDFTVAADCDFLEVQNRHGAYIILVFL